MKRSSSSDGIREFTLKSGKKTYEARINRAGEGSLSKRFNTRAEALDWKRRIDISITDGLPVLKPKNLLVRKVVEDYLKYRENSTTPLPANQVTEYQRVSLDLGDRAVGKLRRTDLEDWLALLQSTNRGFFNDGTAIPPYSAASARKFYYCLKTAVDWHSSEWRYHVDEFLFKANKNTIPSAWSGHRERRLSEAEERRLYSSGIDRKDTYSQKDWENIIGFALETAMREQEIVYARWTDIFQEGYKLHIPKEHSKTRKSRVVLLSRRARDIVNNLQASASDDNPRIFHLIPNPNSLCDAFARLTKRAEIEDLHFHDLRHEGVSRLCESGKLNLMQIMEMTGHSSMATFQGYLHLLRHENSVTLD